MTTPELIQYVKSEVEKGVSKDVIVGQLKTQGWTDLDIAEVFSMVRIPVSSSISVDALIPNIIKNTPESIKPSEPIHTADSVATFKNIDPIQNYPSYSSINNPTPEPSLGYQDTIKNKESINEISSVNTMYNNPQVSLKKPNKKILKIIILIILIIMVLFGGFLLYASGYFLKSGDLFSKWIDSSKKNTSVAFDVNLNFDMTNMKVENAVETASGISFKKMDFNMKGSSDYSDENNIKFNNVLTFKAGEIETGIETRMINESLYFSITKSPELSFFSLKPFENKWVVLPLKDESGTLANNPLVSMSPVSSSFFSNITDEQKQQINDIVKKANFIKITKKHLPVIIDNSLSYHFDFDLDKEGIITFAKEMVKYIESLDKNGVSPSALTDEDYNKIFTYMKSFKGEMWIGIFDKLPHKMMIDMEIVNPEKLEDGVSKLSISAVYSDWNKPVEVVVPSDSTTIEELLSGMFGSNLTQEKKPEETIPNNSQENNTQIGNIQVVEPKTEEVKSKSIDEQKMELITKMRVSAPVFYNLNNSYKSFCTSRSDSGAYVIAVQLPKNTEYRCKDSLDAWVSWAKLSTGKYWCADSLGSSKDILGIPKNLSCDIK
jgi:hypothetical protein